jgi:RNA polymerase sigma-70 factor (ECF subfamily)
MNPSKKQVAVRGEDYPELVRAVRGGDREAIERLLMRAQEVAWRFSMLVCGGADDAEDAMQDALLKTFRHAARIREPEAFRTWLYRTVRNACLVRRRRRVGEPSRMLSLDDLVPSPDQRSRVPAPVDRGRLPDDLVVNTRLRKALRRAMAKLPRPFRVVVFLREIEGLSTRDVARIVGISEASVKTRLHRARLFLRRELEGA